MKNAFLILFFCGVFTNTFAQYTITGNVVNELGEPIEFVSVFLPYTDYATYTDADGNYEISDIESDYYDIKFTYVGYRDKKFEIDLLNDTIINVVLTGMIYNIDELEIRAVENRERDPFANSQYDREEFDSRNVGQDIPTLLSYTPSLTVSSDAGTGIGYSALRIRGVDQARINVTINGIPLNDAESHQVFWVDLPDLSSYVNNIQINRGVGSSTNGSGAFGGSVHLDTDVFSLNPFAKFSGTVGSFGTYKYSGQLGTGLMNGKYSINFGYSGIQSDGYIDRATSDLSSYNISLRKISDNGFVKFNIISGRERTYQAWNGVPEGIFNDDETQKLEHYNNNAGSLYLTQEDSINYFSSDRRYNYYTYEDQVDKYDQTHFQFLTGRKINESTNINVKLNYTKGKGYFEEFKHQQDLDDYDLINYKDTLGNILEVADLVRRRWLDNDFLFGAVDAEWKSDSNFNMVAGVSYSYYNGDHFGRVISVDNVNQFGRLRPYYSNVGKKKDFNVFTKLNWEFISKLNTFVDLQFRNIDYSILGDDNDDVNINIDTDFQFFNPKLGLSYLLKDDLRIYSSVAVAQKEPVRSDLIDNQNEIEAEKLTDFELGVELNSEKISLGVNAYHMSYDNQLVATGELNDVGAALRQNVDKSSRTGVEIILGANFLDKFSYSGSVTLSKNKIEDFEYVLYDYATDPVERIVQVFENTDISFSPSVIYNSKVSYDLNGLRLHWLTNYVGKQFLDNTSDDSKSLDAYLINGFNAEYIIQNNTVNEIKLKLLVNNIFDVDYASNGYTYSYLFGDLIQENFYYPQAGINFLFGVDIRL